MPASSLYCSQKSLSMISAAATKRRIAASPAVRLPLLGLLVSSATASELWDKSIAPTAAVPAVVRPFLMNERRPSGEKGPLSTSFIDFSFERFVVHRTGLETRHDR